MTDEWLGTNSIAFLFEDGEQSSLKAWCKLCINDTWYSALTHAAGYSNALDPMPEGEIALLTDDTIFDRPRSYTAVLVAVLSRATSLDDIVANEVERSLILAPIRAGFRSTKALLVDSTKCRHEGLVELTRIVDEPASANLPELRTSVDPSTTASPALPWRVR